MRIVYVLLSPTFGMHQYTADLANRLAGADHDVHLITTTRAPHDRYTPEVVIHTPVETNDTGFSVQSLHVAGLRQVKDHIEELQPDVVHITGPHMWNLPLIQAMKKKQIPVIHTIHDLDPHLGRGVGLLIRLWNHLIIHAADHLLVHGQTYEHRLRAMGVPEERITWTPLLHLFVGGTWLEAFSDLALASEYQPWALFFGRLKKYKGLEYLITACAMMGGANTSSARVVVAGYGDLSELWSGSLPERLAVHNHLIHDEEAMDLFSRCGLLVLPYVDATQSALIAAAYYFRKPVIVTRTGALPEYVEEGRTGYIVEPDHPAGLARRLEQMLGDLPSLERMGTAGRAWYDARRTEEQTALVRMYDRVNHEGLHQEMVSQGTVEGDYGLR